MKHVLLVSWKESAKISARIELSYNCNSKAVRYNYNTTN